MKHLSSENIAIGLFIAALILMKLAGMLDVTRPFGSCEPYTFQEGDWVAMRSVTMVCG